MYPALLVVVALSAPTAEVEPVTRAPVEVPVEAPPQEAPSPEVEVVAEEAARPEPPPAVAPAVAPADKPPGRAPAVAKTDTTVGNARLGDEVEVSKFKYKIGKGATVASKDGRFSLQIRGRLQLRYEVEHPNTPGEATEQSIQIRRARLLFQGNVFSPHVRYYIQFGFSPSDMTSGLPGVEGSIRRNPLRDARIEFDRLRDFNVWAGQMKVPFNRQRMNSSAYLSMPDRTSINGEFTLDRDIGVQVLSRDLGGLGHRLSYYAGVFAGEGRNAGAPSDPGMLYVGRFEVLPFGKFDDYTEGDVTRSKTPGLSIAAAYAFQDRAHAARGTIGDPPADGGTTNFHHVNADIFFKWRGVSLASALHWRKGFNRRSGGALDGDGNPIPPVAARSGLGWYAQLGWVVPKIPLEIVGRYGLIRNTFGAASSLRDSDEVGAGLNYYFVGHDLKLQLDYFRLWDQSIGATAAERAAGGVDRVRLQLQVYF